MYSRCKACCKKTDTNRKDKTDLYKKKWAENNPENKKNYYQQNREKILKKTREKYSTPEGKLKQKKQNLKRYGLTLEKYNQMLINQNHKCGICAIDEINTKTKYLVVDHNHSTKEVRLLLCAPCNFLIGLANENCQILINAAQYLEKFNNNKNNIIILKEVLNAR